MRAASLLSARPLLRPSARFCGPPIVILSSEPDATDANNDDEQRHCVRRLPSRADQTPIKRTRTHATRTPERSVRLAT